MFMWFVGLFVAAVCLVVASAYDHYSLPRCRCE
jgi:hypothetical protein